MKRLMMLLVVFSVSVYFTGCGEEAGKKGEVSPSSAAEKTIQKAAEKVTAENVIQKNKGKVLLLLLGMEGCPGTEKATPYLSEYTKSKPEGVEVYRIDVPPSVKKPLKPASDLDPELKYLMDNSRKLAGELEFFFYPTLYIFDKDGTLRFYGDCKGEKVEKMVSAMLKEKPGVAKKMYTPKLPDIGETAFNFTGKTLDNKETSLKQISSGSDANLLLFCKTFCPFSNKAVLSLDEIEKELKGKKLSITIINIAEDPDKIREFYTKKAPGRTVIVDKDDSISKKKYGVSAVPFFYVLDKDLKIVERKPFTTDIAKTALKKTLGMKTSGCGPASGAG